MSSSFDPALLTEHVEVALDELVRASGLEAQEIVELVEYGVFEPSFAGGARSTWRFSSRYIVLGRQARRLKSDFGLDVSGLAVALTYLQRIDELEAEVATLRCQILR